MNLNAYLDILHTILRFRGKWAAKLVLVWDNASTHFSNKAKDFYLNNRFERIELPARSLDLISI